jgi:hypothetical protein
LPAPLGAKVAGFERDRVVKIVLRQFARAIETLVTAGCHRARRTALGLIRSRRRLRERIDMGRERLVRTAGRCLARDTQELRRELVHDLGLGQHRCRQTSRGSLGVAPRELCVPRAGLGDRLGKVGVAPQRLHLAELRQCVIEEHHQHRRIARLSRVILAVARDVVQVCQSLAQSRRVPLLAAVAGRQADGQALRFFERMLEGPTLRTGQLAAVAVPRLGQRVRGVRHALERGVWEPSADQREMRPVYRYVELRRGGSQRRGLGRAVIRRDGRSPLRSLAALRPPGGRGVHLRRRLRQFVVDVQLAVAAALTVASAAHRPLQLTPSPDRHARTPSGTPRAAALAVRQGCGFMARLSATTRTGCVQIATFEESGQR